MTQWLLRFARPELGRLVAAALLGFAALGCGIGLMATAAWLISRAAQHPPVLYLTVAIVGVRAFGLGRGLLRYCERLVGHDAAFGVLARLRVGVYSDLEPAAPAGLGRLRTGDAMSRLVGDTEIVQDLFVRGLLPIAVATLTALGSVTLFLVLLPTAGLVLLLGLLIAGVLIPLGSLWFARRSDASLSPARASLSGSVVEYLGGLPDLMAFDAADRALAKAREHDRRLTTLSARSAMTAGLGSALTMLTLGGVVLGCLIAGVASGQGVLLAVLALTPFAVFELVAPLPDAVRAVARGRVAIRRLRELADLPRPTHWPTVLPSTEAHSPATTSSAATPTGGTRLEGDSGSLSLWAKNLTVRWAGAATPTLQGVDLILRPGKRVALIGASGAGKSTLVSALLGFLQPESGQILLGGVPISSISDDHFRRIVSACEQDAHFFHSSIRNNLLIACPDAGDVRLEDVLRRVRLWDWVAAQPNGLDTLVGERGLQLSGGERQRLALARTLLVEPAVLLLDEPTAHLDEATADTLARDILEVTRDRTTLLVTHRLDLLSQVDEVVELRHGSVIPVPSGQGHVAGTFAASPTAASASAAGARVVSAGAAGTDRTTTVGGS